MGRFSTLALALAVLAAAAVGTHAQIQNVLLEQHTGAWCGWCPDGSVKMDEILALYGDRVIGVKIHNGDAMAIPEQAIIGDALGLPGFPSGTVDRKEFGGAVFLSRGDWKAACEARMQQPAKAQVDCFYFLDRTARTVDVHVTATIVRAMSFPLKLNAFIVEDDVTGTGPGYDQHNYLSGRPGFENNPYYNEPPTLVGYHHMKVVRQMLGGAWGVAGMLPTSVKAGEVYAYTFEASLDGSWNIDKLHFVGLLQADAPDNKEIINCAVAVPGSAPLNKITDSNTPATQALPTGSELVKTYTLANLSDQAQTYTVKLATTSRTAADWSAQFASGATTLTASGAQPALGQIEVPADGTVELSLTLKVGPTLGWGDAQMTLQLQGTTMITRSRTVSAVSREVKHLLLESGSDYSLRPFLGGTPAADAMTMAPDDYVQFADELTDVNLVIWNKGPADGFTSTEVAAIKSKSDVATFLCGDLVLASMSDANLGYFGLERIGWNAEGVAPFYTVWLSGQTGDVITGSLGGSIQGNLIAYYINMVKILDERNVFPIMHFQNDGFRQIGTATYAIAAKDTIFAVRSTKYGGRTVMLGISPYVIATSRTRQTLVANIIDWLAE